MKRSGRSLFILTCLAILVVQPGRAGAIIPVVAIAASAKTAAVAAWPWINAGLTALGAVQSVEWVIGKWEGDPTPAQLELLKNELRKCKDEIKDLPEMRKAIEGIEKQLADRPTKKELEKLFGDFRKELMSDLALLADRIRKLEIEVEVVKGDVRVHGKEIADLILRQKTPRLGHVLLANGGEIKDATVFIPTNRGVTLVRENSDEEEHIPAAKVRTVTTYTHVYVYVPSKKDFEKKPRFLDLDVPADAAKSKLTSAARNSTTSSLHRDMVLIVAGLPGAKTEELKSYTRRRKQDWDELSLKEQYEMFKGWFLQDRSDDIRELAKKSDSTVEQAARELMRREAEAIRAGIQKDKSKARSDDPPG